METIWIALHQRQKTIGEWQPFIKIVQWQQMDSKRHVIVNDALPLYAYAGLSFGIGCGRLKHDKQSLV